jgi:hypothetical protein
MRREGNPMLLFTSAALPQLHEHDHPNLGRLITPRHFPRLADTLAAGYPVAADNDCFRGYRPEAIARMCQAIAPWPSLRARLRKAWPGTLVAPTQYDDLPAVHPNFMWLAVPDVVRCACGSEAVCSARRRTHACAPRGDAQATLELFRLWHAFLVHLPLAYVAQDDSERVGLPWSAPGLRAIFIGGSTEWKLGPAAALVIAEAKRRGLWVHIGRVNSWRRARYFAALGAHSFDGTGSSIARDTNLPHYLRWASAARQTRLAI